MINEDFCSYEVAKLLNEKGFDEKVLAVYIYDSLFVKGENKIVNTANVPIILAPTHQMAMKWLRLKHNILLFLLPAQENGKLVYLVEVWTWNEEEGIYESTYAPMPRKEPERAIEAALKYCLQNLI